MDKMAEGQQGSLPFRFTGSDGIPLHSFHDGSSPVHDERLLTGFLAAMNGLLGLSAGHLMELPQNYTLRQLPSGAFALYGHPSARAFASPHDFMPHIRWLISGKISNCSCCLCVSMTSRDGAPNEIRLPPLAQAFALPPSTYMTLPPIYNLLSQRNSNAIQGSQAGGEEDAEMVYNAPQEPIDYPKRYQQLIEYIKDTKTMNEKMERILVTANERIRKLKFENKFLVETLHEKNDALYEPNPYSSSKRIYELDGTNHHSESDRHITVFGSDGARNYNESGGVHDNGKTKTPRRKRARLFDPNAPKRPVNAFMVFSEMQRDAMKQERDDLAKTMPESEDLVVLRNLSKAAAARWKVLPEEEKQIYKDIYKSQIEQFEKDMEEYRKQHPDSIASVIARNRQQSGVKRPASKPLSSDQGAEMTSTYVLPFQVFYEEQVEAFKATLDVPHTELDMKLKLLERWNALMPEDKLSFETKAKEVNAANNATLESVKEDDEEEDDGHPKEGDDGEDDDASSCLHQDDLPLVV